MEKNSFLERYLTPIAVVVGALILALAYVYGAHGTAPVAQQNGQQQAPAVDIKDVKVAGEPFIGDPNAPVTMAVFYDYQCPFCKQFDENVMPQLYTNYVQTGKVKVVFKGFEFLGNDSIAGDEFGRAVWELYPDSFYDWYKAMADAQDQEGDQGFGDQASIVTMTKSKVPAINTDNVVALVTKNKTAYDAAITATRTEAQNLGITGTPSIIVGKQLFSALSPADFYTQISGAIDAELK
jgi:protein-disulfide isomerase